MLSWRSLFNCSPFNDAVSNSDYITRNSSMAVKDGIENTWEKAVWLDVKHYLGICLEVLRKTKKYLRAVGVLSEIRTEHLLNTNQKPYRLDECSVLSYIDSCYIRNCLCYKMSSTGRKLVKQRMEGVWKEMAVICLKIISQIWPGRTEEDNENSSFLIANHREEIRNCELPTVKRRHQTHNPGSVLTALSEVVGSGMTL
jgi:hypothetical protein